MPISRNNVTLTNMVKLPMYKKLAKDAAVVVIAYLWSLALITKLVATATYMIFPHDIITAAVISSVSFMSAYVGAWLFFNKWNAKFLVKAIIACGIFVILFIISGLIDAAIVRNMSGHN